MKSKPIRELFEAYSKCLEGYFTFYCKQAKVDLGFDI
jgi:hypothetical protein